MLLMFFYVTIDHFLQNLFDGIVNEALQNLQIIDDKVIETISSSIKNDPLLKERVKKCKGLVDETKLLCLSSYWSSFDYKLIKILIKKCVPKLKEKMKRYSEKFKNCSLETFVDCFRMDCFEQIDSEEILIVKLKLSGNDIKMKYIKKIVCKNIKDVMNTTMLRLQKLQMIEDCFLFTFGAEFQDSKLALNKLKGKRIAKFLPCVTEVRLRNFCLYDLDGM